MAKTAAGLILQAVLVPAGCLCLQAQEPPCAPFLSPQSVLDCALTNHPDVKRASAARAQAAALEDVALQRPNPDLESRGLWGRSQEGQLNKVEGALLHTFELGGKRESRAERARAERLRADAELLKSKEEVALETVAALFRLRQIRDEAGIIEKTLDSISGIRRQLKSRPRLTPEQEASLEVFDLAEDDANLRKAGLDGEAAALIRSIELAISTPLPTEAAVLPSAKTVWPALPDASPGALAGSVFLRAGAELQTARADVSLSRSAAYPDMKAGPAMERDGEGSTVRQSYGFSLALPLPLYQRNAAGCKAAELGFTTAELGQAAAQKSVEAERAKQLARYRAAVRALKTAPANDVVQAKLLRLQESASRGLVPNSLVIETYRQIFELTKSRHEAELVAVQALWKVYIVEGRALMEKM